MKNKILLTTVITCFVFALSFAQKASDQELLDKQAFKEVIQNPQVQLVDVRTKEEFDQGSIDHAVNIDFLSPDFLTKVDTLDKQKPVYIFCKSGKRSAKAKDILIEQGFLEVFELKGGYSIWEQE